MIRDRRYIYGTDLRERRRAYLQSVRDHGAVTTQSGKDQPTARSDIGRHSRHAHHGRDYALHDRDDGDPWHTSPRG